MPHIPYRGSIEIQHRLNQASLDLESLFVAAPSSPSSTLKPVETFARSSIGFDSDFGYPRPPEELQVSPDEFGDTPLSPDGPIQSSVVQMFLSELQGHTPSNPLGLGGGSAQTGMEASEKNTDLEPECEILGSGSSSPSVPSFSVPATPPSLECDMITDPMDDPFLSSFTDISLLHENFPLLITGGLKNTSTPSPPECDVNVAVVQSSSEYDFSSSTNQKVFNLSECVSLLTSHNTHPTSSITTTHPTSPSHTSTATSPVNSHVPQTLLLDFDFTAISEQSLASIVSSISTPQDPYPPTSPPAQPQTTTSTIFPSPESPPTSSCPDSPAVPVNPRKRRRCKGEGQVPSSGSSEDLSSELCNELSEEEKRKIRRVKNNKASQVSRARRRGHRQGNLHRAEELVEENQRLRVQVEEMTGQVDTLKRLLMERLTHTQSN